ncbi:hypothetical protein HPB48_005128 [Haemaphysalis longicornis]|uniref:Alanine--glyoxylate aminotransferase 2, mitochondrial n=1 Tax=Haemaphysalis longicornis TaxID=44386 RepID=A0A9J6FG89_HAELO|nr:hypothetical protein HPB48_005128 [Haemaphysalis longicornis]
MSEAAAVRLGKSHAEIVALRQRHLNPSLSSNLLYKEPLLLTQGYMQWLWDHTGKRYLDMLAGIVTVSVGHCHPKVVAAAEDQLKRLWHTSNVYLYPTVHEFAEKLTAKLPGDLKVCYFTNSGSEANDLAMMMARLYTGAFDIVALRNAYHGMSPYCASLCAVGNYKHHIPSSFGIFHAMNPDPYRGVWGGSKCRDSPVQADRNCACGPECEAASRYADQLSEVLQQCVSKKRLAAFFAESIQGVGGTVQYPKGYLKKVHKLVKDKGGLFVSDEVLDEEGCMENSNVTGTRLLQALAPLREEFSLVGDVRGKGLMLGVELVENKASAPRAHALHLRQFIWPQMSVLHIVLFCPLQESKAPLPAVKVNAILEHCREMGLLIGKGGQYGHVLRLKPPMCITEADVDFAAAVLKRAIAQVASQQ